MDNTRDIIDLALKDGLSMYDRFENIRDLIGSAMTADEPEVIHGYFAEIMLNMMLMKVDLYTDHHTAAHHFFNDYQTFLAFIKDATDYLKVRYQETSGRSGFSEADTVELIFNHYQEYAAQHDPA